ncbi:cilia-and flagella-associated protein 96-like [Rhynchophorus ferrugineus]|uniref:cilia-and flagella-associated protein 96-like n=1 Tax=Rhynchophorus ferrugineus TaxID=354439 RepID=UPI003FCCAB46
METLGKKYGKPDIERLGLFSELPFMNGKGYVSPFQKAKTEKGKNLLAGGPKVKTEWQDCYFDKEFKRLFTGEALKGRGRKEPPSKFKNVSERPFVPAGETKWHGCPGDWHGTFGGKVEAFSGKPRPKPPYKHEPGNLMTNPGKKGGYGYVNIGLNPYPQHSVEKYGIKAKYKEYGRVLDGPMVVGTHAKPYFTPNPFQNPEKMKPGPTYVPPKEKELPALPPGKFIPTGPGKWPGGCHAGCFEKYPEHKAEKYQPKIVDTKAKKFKDAKFFPQSYGDKTYYTTSVINENLRFRVNSINYKTFEPTFIKHLVN